MSHQLWNLVEEPRGQTYRSLIRYAARACSTAILVVRDNQGSNELTKIALDRLRPHLLNESRESRWPGTELLGATALVCRYSLNSECVEVIAELVDGLYDWRQPRMPEDLCLLRNSDEPWLVTISHERDAYLKVSNEEWQAISEQATGIRAECAAF